MWQSKLFRCLMFGRRQSNKNKQLFVVAKLYFANLVMLPLTILVILLNEANVLLIHPTHLGWVISCLHTTVCWVLAGFKWNDLAYTVGKALCKSREEMNENPLCIPVFLVFAVNKADYCIWQILDNVTCSCSCRWKLDSICFIQGKSLWLVFCN